MKRNKTILVLVIVFVILVSYLVGKQYLPQGDGVESLYNQSVEYVDQEAVNNIVIIDDEENVEINLIDGKYIVDGYEADVELIGELLSLILSPEDVEQVSETNIRHEPLGVTNGAPKIVLSTSDSELSVFLGTSTGMGRYLRIEGQDAVYLIDGLTAAMTSLELTSWVENTLTAIDENNIKSVVVSGAGNLSIEQREGEWYENEGDGIINKASINSFINTLVLFETQGLLANDSEEVYPTSPSMSILIEVAGGDNVELLFYEGDNDVLVTNSNREGQYVISNALMNSLNIDKDDLVIVEATESVDE